MEKISQVEHGKFAEIYDIFMKGVNYNSWYRFLRKYIKKSGKILDLGCGTGEFIWRFLRDGYEVVGIDISESMLNVARNKLDKRGYGGKYELFKEDIIKYNHNEKVDYIVCNFDTVNYFENEDNFEKFVQVCKNNLKNNGLLIFDVVTEDIFEEIFENDIFLDEEEEYTSIWRHEKLSEKRHLVEIDLFIRENMGENLFRKYNDKQYKYIYDLNWIVDIVRENGFEIVDSASNGEFGEGRIFFIFKFKN